MDRIVTAASSQLLGWLAYWARDDDAVWPENGLLADLRAGVRPGPRIAWSDDQLDAFADLVEREPVTVDALLRTHAAGWADEAATAHLGPSPAPELAPLLGSGPDSDGREVRMVATHPWHAVVAGLLPDVAQHFHDLEVQVVVEPVEARDAPAGLGAIAHDLLGKEPTSTRVNGSLGAAPLRRALGTLASAWDVPIVTVDGDGRVRTDAHPPRWTSRQLWDAMARALGGTGGKEEWAALVDDGLDVFVSRRGDGSGFEPTLSLFTLFDEERFGTGANPEASACVALLERTPGDGPSWARELRRLIDLWTQQQIWAVNYVHEMVLHDQAHSISVDRNVAALCGPLLAAGRLSAEQVFVLAVCAWLHDWGHASGLVNGHLPTDPVEVRNYHGPLTARKLDEHLSRHGLGGGDDDEIRRKGMVQLLCAHHQGWTSCDHQPPDLRPDRRSGVIRGGHGLGLGVRSGPESQEIGSFDAEAGALGFGEEELSQLHELLALLRVADAIDVGAHRVPHDESQDAFRQGLLPAYTQAPGVALRAAKVETDALSKIDTFYQAVVGAIAARPGVTTEEEVDALIDQHRNLVDARFFSTTPPPSMNEGLWRIGGDALDFARHLARQVAYFRLHARVRAVVPVLAPGPEPDSWVLTLHVAPVRGERGADRSEGPGAEKAVTVEVRELFLRELGEDVQQDGKVKQNKLKRPIGGFLYDLGIGQRPRAREVEPPVPAPRSGPVDQKSLPEPSARTWAQLAVGERSWRLLSGRDGLRLAELASPTDPAPSPPGAVGSMALSANGAVAAHLGPDGLNVYTLEERDGLVTLTRLKLSDECRGRVRTELGGGVLLAVAGLTDRVTVRLVVSDRETTRVRSLDLRTGLSTPEDGPEGPSRAAVFVGGKVCAVGPEGRLWGSELPGQVAMPGPVHRLDAAVGGDRLAVVSAGLAAAGAAVVTTFLFGPGAPRQVLGTVENPVATCPDEVCVVRPLGPDTSLSAAVGATGGGVEEFTFSGRVGA